MAKRKPRSPVLLESPYAGNHEVNIAYAQAALKDSILRGEAPLASHLLYTQVLNDKIPAERRLGLNCADAWLKHCEYVVVYANLGISRGMMRSIRRATKLNIPVDIRYLAPPKAKELEAPTSPADPHSPAD